MVDTVSFPDIPVMIFIILGATLILILKVHFVVFATASATERISLGNLPNSEGFLEILKKKYAQVLHEKIGV